MAFALVNPVSALWQRRGLTSLLMSDDYDAFAAPQDSARALSGNGPRVQPAHAHAGQSQPGASQPGQPRERQTWQQSRQQATSGQTNQTQANQARPQAQAHAPVPTEHAAQNTGQHTGDPMSRAGPPTGRNTWKGILWSAGSTRELSRGW